MCGIGGIFRYNTFNTKKEREEAYKIATRLLLGLQDRGSDATGVALINTHKDTIRVYKLPIEAKKFVEKNRFRKEFMNTKNDFNLVLLHTRMPTVGSSDNPHNNHPIYDTKYNNVLVHNGGIVNYEEIRKQFKLQGKAEVDSEVILAMFNNKGQDIKKTLKELRGGLAIALYDKNKLYIYSYSRPVNISYFPDKDSYIFASEEKYIIESVKQKSVDYGIWKLKKFVEGYTNSDNCELRNEELVEATFDTKENKIHIAKEDDVSCKPYVYKDDWNYQNNGCGISRVFNDRTNMRICEDCLVKFCQFRDTELARGCRARITSDKIVKITDQYVYVKNKGKQRLAVFYKDRLKKVGDYLDDEESDIDEIGLMRQPNFKAR